MEMKSLKKFDYGKPRPKRIRAYRSFRGDSKDEYLWLFTRAERDALGYSVGFFCGRGEKIDSQPPARFLLFPPTKETTGLNFVIHAPFLLNESREGIRAGAQHNRKMIGLLAELAADSLSYLKQIGIEKGVRLLGENLFDIVPYDESIFSPLDDVDQISFAPHFIT